MIPNVKSCINTVWNCFLSSFRSATEYTSHYADSIRKCSIWWPMIHLIHQDKVLQVMLVLKKLDLIFVKHIIVKHIIMTTSRHSTDKILSPTVHSQWKISGILRINTISDVSSSVPWVSFFTCSPRLSSSSNSGHHHSCNSSRSLVEYIPYKRNPLIKRSIELSISSQLWGSKSKLAR
jgi:hypothetical protein